MSTPGGGRRAAAGDPNRNASPALLGAPGAASLTRGAAGAFYTTPSGETLDDANGELVCATATDVLLDIGECTLVTCDAEIPVGVDVWVVVDPEGAIADCHSNNNVGASSLALCPPGPN
jgi:hypothetical protein